MFTRLLNRLRPLVVLLVVVLLGVAAGGVITLLQQRADASRQAQSQVGSVQFALADLEGAPFSADPRSGGSPGYARSEIESDNTFISENVRALIAAGSPPAPLLGVLAAVHDAEPQIHEIFEIGGYRGGNVGPLRATVDRLHAALIARVTSTLGLLRQAQRIYSQRATQTKTYAISGSLATILLLLAVFVLFYRRATVARARAIVAWASAERLSVENARLLEASRDEAMTDPLTELGNRRAFKRDLDEILPRVTADAELMAGMFDLDGFKQYNDTFGHAAGDALLARLAGRLKDTTAGLATAYRMGGDEFCVLAQTSVPDGQRLVRLAVAALSDTGEGWHVGCSWGLAWIPSEATGSGEALRLADDRMYAYKTSRATAGTQAAAALIQVLIERDVDLSTHISRVARLATATAHQLGLAEHEITRIGLSAQLHDIGKTAIPDSILNKPGPLSNSEWDFMRCHTLIGERIVAAAPSLAHTAILVRSSHERWDGSGYPDHLSGTDIPLGARIVSVCDAYDAIVTSRPYRHPRTHTEAITELRRRASSQFDPDVITAFCAIAPTSQTATTRTIAGDQALETPIKQQDASHTLVY
jgi:diguanylate cyclase (GGDEF)-like protein